MKKIIVFLALAVSLAQSRNLPAEIVVELDNVVVSPGSTAFVTAWISDNSATPSSLSAYNIPLNITTLPGFSFAGDSAITNSSALPTFTPIRSNSNANQNFDYTANSSGGSIALSSSPTALFQIEFMVGAGVAPGTVQPVEFEENPGAINPITGGFFPQPTIFSLALDGVNTNGQDISGLIVNQGSIQVEAIPEPSGLVLLLGSIGFAGLKRRRIS